ncbi:OLAH isoform 2 [Pongo abelii]|uniref:oleoyl-[acyl-carrier-protein] hydrolase n=1 Tax=Pongo abelii TaxID=9601 RepID=A0A2J8VKP8_PONAB|nr:OLAH isoform 2 [Pongo abelii]
MEREDQPKRTRNEDIFNCLYKNPEATFKLICFPWLGGGSIHFARWGQDTHDSLEETASHYVAKAGLKLLGSSDPPASACPRAGSKAWQRLPKDELSEEQISHYLLEFGGTPKHFAEDKEFVKQCSPIIRADLNIVSSCTSNVPSKAVLSCDLTCFVGSEDTAKDMEAWKDVTSGNANIHQLPGGHFYLLDPANEKLIKNYIIKCLEVSSIAKF